MYGELGQDDGLSAEQELMRVMGSSLDRLQQEMVKIFTRLKDMKAKFGFLLDTVHLMEVEHQDSTDATLCQNCNDLATIYHTDFDGSELYAEICDSRLLLRTHHDSKPTTPLELLHSSCPKVKLYSQISASSYIL